MILNDAEPLDDLLLRCAAPSGDAGKTLAEGHQRLVEDGVLLDDAERFDLLLQRCQALALQVNAAALGAT